MALKLRTRTYWVDNSSQAVTVSGYGIFLTAYKAPFNTGKSNEEREFDQSVVYRSIHDSQRQTRADQAATDFLNQTTDSQSRPMPRPEADAAKTDAGSKNSSFRPTYSTSLPNPGKWTRENAKCWIATMRIHLKMHGLWEVVNGDVTCDDKATEAAGIIKQYLLTSDALAASGVTDGHTLWQALVKRTQEDRIKDLEEKKARLKAFTIKDVDCASDYIFDKAMRLAAHREVGGDMVANELYDDFFYGIEVVNQIAGHIIRCLAGGSLEKAHEYLANNPAVIKKSTDPTDI